MNFAYILIIDSLINSQSGSRKIMTRGHVNAIMFAYRYDNLPIFKILYKQMIGEIVIMRNPWPIFGIAALSGAACLIYDHFFSYESMWIAVVALLVLLALCFFAYCKYERWLAKKLNPYVVAYQSDHDLEKLKQGLNRWRPWAFSKHSRNIITANWFSALLEQQRWTEAEETLEQFLRRAKSIQDRMGYHLLRGDYARAIGDTELEEQERLLSEQLKKQLGNKKGEARVPANAKESKHAFFCWLSFSFGLALFGIISNIVTGNALLGSVGAGLFILGLFSLPVCLIWLILWMIRHRKETVK